MTNYEWCCTSTRIAAFIPQLTTCSKIQIWYFVNVAQTFFFVLQDASKLAGQVLSTFEGEVLFERKSPTATVQEASPCVQIDPRIFGRPERPKIEVEKAENYFSSFLLERTSLGFSQLRINLQNGLWA